MKAIVQDAYGSTDVYHFAEMDKPRPAPDEVLVQVRATSIHPDVWHVMRGWPYPLRLMGAGLRKPKDLVPGTDLAGTVVAIGKQVTKFQPGDDVFGEIVRVNQWRNGGSFAEFAAVPTDRLTRKPEGLTFEQAAAVPTAALLALQSTRGEAKVAPGQRVLVNGAGGGVGSFVVQMAKAYGANVTAVDSSSKLAMLSEIGADRVIDFAREDFTSLDDRYDLVVDIPGNHPFKEVRRVLKPKGKYVWIGHDNYGRSGGHVVGPFREVLSQMARSPFTEQLPDVNFKPLRDIDDPMAEIASMLESGQITPVVDRTFPLSEVPEAMRYLMGGTVQGKIVITI